ncbi:protein [Candida orthopsilosis Co 90-125]|uniref:isoleucine--tRNA ligase n=1 Tax=Candida orthopsilosis (strain 90-125) TaxID=1136231 RepID=H8WVX4_CANO9|nr:protein [Candida orthopsilosis Co 90-125]CCG20598.1 protein [Candida orthopsilosis Co 90-125]
MLRFSPYQTRCFATCAAQLNKISYSKTLQLPQTSFSPKIPRGSSRDELIQRTGVDIYKWQQQYKTNHKPFFLHDGPPYANGKLHVGHALNKICKDIIIRYQLIHEDKLIKYQPGWDCHGLPIELKVEYNLGKLEFKDPVEIRKACREYAMTMINNQRKEFLELGIMTDFSKPYITMDHKFENDQLQVFSKLVENGLLSQQLKPVWYGCDTQTALAEAELEYNDKHKSVAIYVKFPVTGDKLRNYIKDNHPDLSLKNEKIKLLIWTSTPWTIPANKTICVSEHLSYTLIMKGDEVLVVAKTLAEDVLELDPDYTHVDVEIPGTELIGVSYVNPAAEDNVKRPVIHGDHVVGTAGTGLVHSAPAHGREDYLVAKQNGITIDSSCVDNKGKFIVNELPPGFQQLGSLKVNEIRSNMLCVDVLKQHDMIYNVNKNFVHSYPYDWRSQTPVIQRATPQWFVNVDKIKPFALEALGKVEFHPSSGYNRLTSFIENRDEWCISRQRSWGVPLPIVYDANTHKPVMDLEVINHTISKIDEFGTDEWFVKEDNISRWLPSDMDGGKYYKGQDTMDVWFDSGTSWSTLRDNIKECNETTEPLADVYLEGSDQHRGWFQSSLLNKVIYSGNKGQTFQSVAPYKAVITHGFITDAHGQKMSKTKGNIFSPHEAIEGCKKPWTPLLGTDGLRLWAASSNYQQDVGFHPEVLTRVSEVGKKYRVTFKYLLGNLYDFEMPVEYQSLSDLDKYILHTLHQLQQTCAGYYKSYNFSRVVSSVNAHVNSVLSAIYFDVSKDCLYTDDANSTRRRAIQTVLNEILKTYVGILAPIQPLTVQEVWDEYVKINKDVSDSPFKEPSNTYALSNYYVNHDLELQFSAFFKLRDEIYKEIETLKQNNFFKNKLELEIKLSNPLGNSSLFEFMKLNKSYLDDLFLVSKANLVESEDLEVDNLQVMDINGEKVGVVIKHSDDHKCGRCWKFTASEPESLCGKCNDVVNRRVE